MNTKESDLAEFIERKIREKTLDKQIELIELSHDMDFMEEGMLDSMEFVSLIGEIEILCGVDIDFSEYEPAQFSTIKGLVKCVYPT